MSILKSLHFKLQLYGLYLVVFEANLHSLR